MSKADWFLVVGSVILGQFALLLVEALRSYFERSRERRVRREDFQHDTLLELQEAMLHLAEAYGQIVGQILTEGKFENGSPASIQEAEARFWILYFRVTDEKTQAACKSYLGGTRKIAEELLKFPNVSTERLKAAYDESGWQFNDAQRAIGENLREL